MHRGIVELSIVFKCVTVSAFVTDNLLTGKANAHIEFRYAGAHQDKLKD